MQCNLGESVMKGKDNTGPLVHFRDVGLSLGGHSILEGVTFTVEPGTIHCLIGPNGGGKTSLVRSLLGQMPHTGSIGIGWNGNRVTGYVPQTLDFDRTLPLTVEDFMAMTHARRPVFCGFGKDRSKITEALERVGMAGKRGYLFGGLSGGERQRVLLAQALIPRPALLILDEPSTGLDRRGDEVMQGLLRELREEGATVLMVHHDLAEVRKTADAVTCINRSLQFCGPARETLTPERVFSIFSCTQAA